jgi:hypothetical protein
MRKLNPTAATITRSNRMTKIRSPNFDQVATPSLRGAKRRSNPEWTIAQRPEIAALRSQ